jgi:ferredoxin
MFGREENPDIFQMLYESSKKKREAKTRLLETLNVKEYFKEGSIKIDRRICQGAECKLCIKVCPTYALYFKDGEIKITEDLCIYCASCVISCIVDNCIQITRKRLNGEVERYSNLHEVHMILENLNSKKRIDMVNRRCKSKEFLSKSS